MARKFKLNIAWACFILTYSFACQGSTTEIKTRTAPDTIGRIINSMLLHFMNLRDTSEHSLINFEESKDFIWKTIPQTFFNAMARKGDFARAKAGKLIDFGNISNFSPEKMDYVVLANLLMKNAINYPKSEKDFFIVFDNADQNTKLSHLAVEMIAVHSRGQDNGDAIRTAVTSSANRVRRYVNELGLFQKHNDICEETRGCAAFLYFPPENCTPVVLVRKLDDNIEYEDKSPKSPDFSELVDLYQYERFNCEEYKFISLEENPRIYSFDSYMQLKTPLKYCPGCTRFTWKKLEKEALTTDPKDVLTIYHRDHLINTKFSSYTGILSLWDIAYLRLSFEEFPNITKLIFPANQAYLAHVAKLTNVEHIAIQCCGLKHSARELNESLAKFKKLKIIEAEIYSPSVLEKHLNSIDYSKLPEGVTVKFMLSPNFDNIPKLRQIIYNSFKTGSLKNLPLNTKLYIDADMSEKEFFTFAKNINQGKKFRFKYHNKRNNAATLRVRIALPEISSYTDRANVHSAIKRLLDAEESLSPILDQVRSKYGDASIEFVTNYGDGGGDIILCDDTDQGTPDPAEWEMDEIVPRPDITVMCKNHQETD